MQGSLHLTQAPVYNDLVCFSRFDSITKRKSAFIKRSFRAICPVPTRVRNRGNALYPWSKLLIPDCCYPESETYPDTNHLFILSIAAIINAYLYRHKSMKYFIIIAQFHQHIAEQPKRDEFLESAYPVRDCIGLRNRFVVFTAYEKHATTGALQGAE